MTGSESVEMKLYHFTVIENLVPISWNGLKPDALGERGTPHAGHPVVWLTRQKSNAATEPMSNISQGLAFRRQCSARPCSAVPSA